MKPRTIILASIAVVTSSMLGLISGVEAANQPNYEPTSNPNGQRMNAPHYQEQQAPQREQQGQPISKNSKKKPIDKNLENQLNRIHQLANASNFDQALVETEQLLSKQPDNLDLYRLRAHLYVAQKDYDKAIQDLSYLITQNHNDPKLFLERGTALLKAGCYRDAARNAKRALQLDINSIDARELLMQANHKMFKK